jgi:hypothetical protein
VISTETDVSGSPVDDRPDVVDLHARVENALAGESLLDFLAKGFHSPRSAPAAGVPIPSKPAHFPMQSQPGSREPERSARFGRELPFPFVQNLEDADNVLFQSPQGNAQEVPGVDIQ